MVFILLLRYRKENVEGQCLVAGGGFGKGFGIEAHQPMPIPSPTPSRSIEWRTGETWWIGHCGDCMAQRVDYDGGVNSTLCRSD